jgi:hypothetical protein
VADDREIGDEDTAKHREADLHETCCEHRAEDAGAVKNRLRRSEAGACLALSIARRHIPGGRICSCSRLDHGYPHATQT